MEHAVRLGAAGRPIGERLVMAVPLLSRREPRYSHVTARLSTKLPAAGIDLLSEPMVRAALAILVLLNLVTLTGQLWPEGAPPFARTVNILFLASNLGFLLWTALSKNPIART